MHSQMDMFRPVLRGLTEIVEEAVPRFLDDTLEASILLLIDYLYKKTTLATPERRLDYYTESKLADKPTVA